jgi:predicted nucleotidyltransferase
MKRKLDKRLHTIGNKIKRDYSAERVILFGSSAKGNATEDSDVDLLVVAPTKERFFERMASVRRLIRDLRDGLAVSPIVLTPTGGSVDAWWNFPIDQLFLRVD